MAKPSGFKTPEARAAYVRLYDDAIGLAPVPVEEADVATAFGTTHVVTAGDPAAPQLVALHGKSFSATMWLPMLPALTATHRVSMIEAPGDVNKSVATDVLSSPERVVAWIDETVGALGIDRAAFVGASIGAWMAARYAIAHPERVERLAILCPAGIVSNISPRAMFTMLRKVGFGVRPTAAGAEEMIDWMSMPATRPLLREDPWRPIVQQFAVGMAGFRSNFREPRPVKCAIEKLARSSIPMLVAIGRLEVLHDGPEMAARFRRQIPRAQVELVDDANHAIFIDQQQLVADLLREFLSR